MKPGTPAHHDHEGTIVARYVDDAGRLALVESEPQVATPEPPESTDGPGGHPDDIALVIALARAMRPGVESVVEVVLWHPQPEALGDELATQAEAQAARLHAAALAWRTR